jgi:ATP adenylyltransferase
MEDAGVPFVVRLALNLERKLGDAARRATARSDSNPFLPPEPDLVVGAVPPHHVAVLNKFNVVPHHLLLVTEHFEDQEMLLTERDFAALWACLAEFDALGFYNGGRDAGASQRHKHLQIAPLPLARRPPALPIEMLLDTVPQGGGILRVPGLGFAHAFVRLPSRPAGAPHLHAQYRELLAACGIGAVPAAGGERQGRPYNLLLTRRWMLLVPRTGEHSDGISVNALGYAGSLFVRDRAQLERVRTRGPMSLLRAVAVPADY